MPVNLIPSSLLGQRLSFRRPSAAEQWAWIRKQLSAGRLLAALARRLLLDVTDVEEGKAKESDVELTAEEEKETRETVERAEIVERYDRGRDGPVDPWEDPTFEVYVQSDRYGFLHPEIPPEGPPQEVVLTEEEVKKKELKRESKWLQMKNEWTKFYGTPKFRSRIYKGVPDKFRGWVWMKLLRVEEVRRKAESSSRSGALEGLSVYDSYRLRARLISEHVRQIDLDINRTYRNHVNFRSRYDVSQQSLFHVLAAYSLYNREVGYCQGMSQIVALLLMYVDEEEAFWGLHQLMTDDLHAMHGFFIPGFPKLMRYQAHHDKVVRKFIPSLRKHLEKIDLRADMYTTKWFFQCFLDKVPFRLALRLWDVYLLDGERVLVAAAYGIMKLHQKTLLKADLERAMRFIQDDLEQDFRYPDDYVLDNLRRIYMPKLRSAKMHVPTPPQTPDSERPPATFGLSDGRSLEDLRMTVSLAYRRKARLDAIALSKSAPVTPYRKHEEDRLRNATEPNEDSHSDETTQNADSPIQPLPSIEARRSGRRSIDKSVRKSVESNEYVEIDARHSSSPVAVHERKLTDDSLASSSTTRSRSLTPYDNPAPSVGITVGGIEPRNSMTPVDLPPRSSVAPVDLPRHTGRAARPPPVPSRKEPSPLPVADSPLPNPQPDPHDDDVYYSRVTRPSNGNDARDLYARNGYEDTNVHPSHDPVVKERPAIKNVTVRVRPSQGIGQLRTTGSFYDNVGPANLSVINGGDSNPSDDQWSIDLPVQPAPDSSVAASEELNGGDRGIYIGRGMSPSRGANPNDGFTRTEETVKYSQDGRSFTTEYVKTTKNITKLTLNPHHVPNVPPPVPPRNSPTPSRRPDRATPPRPVSMSEQHHVTFNAPSRVMTSSDHVSYAPRAPSHDPRFMTSSDHASYAARAPPHDPRVMTSTDHVTRVTIVDDDDAVNDVLRGTKINHGAMPRRFPPVGTEFEYEDLR